LRSLCLCDPRAGNRRGHPGANKDSKARGDHECNAL
jgi:hypothetical protein